MPLTKVSLGKEISEPENPLSTSRLPSMLVHVCASMYDASSIIIPGQTFTTVDTTVDGGKGDGGGGEGGGGEGGGEGGGGEGGGGAGGGSDGGGGEGGGEGGGGDGGGGDG